MGMLAPVIAYLGMDITGFKAGAAESKGIMRGLSGEQGTGGLSKSFMTLGKVATAGAIALGVASVHMAGDFDASMTRLVTSAGETKSNLGMVSDGVLQIAVSTGTSTSQLAAGLYMIESAGYHGAAGLNVLKASAQGARAEGADLNEVANAVTSALNAYHLPASQAVAVTDQLVATVSSGKMRMQDLAASISNVLPVAAAAHISLAQVGGAVATMTATGYSADRATQDLAFSIRALQSPSAVAQQAMAAVGLSSTDLAQNLGSRGLTGTLQLVSQAILQHMGPSGLVLLNSFNQSKLATQSLNAMLAQMPAGLRSVSQEFESGGITASKYSTAIKKLPVDQQVLGQNFETLVKKADGFQASLKSGSGSAVTFTSALSKIMGGAPGLNSALMLTGASAKTFGTNVNTVSQAAKNAGQDVNGWSDIQGTFNFKLSQLKEVAETTGIRIGNVLIPVIESAVGLFAKHQNVALALAAVIGGVLLAAMVNFAVATTVATAKGAIFLAQTIATTVADWAETAAITAMYVAEGVASAATAVLAAVMDTSPVTLIIIGLVALAAAFYEAYEHIGAFRRIVQDAFHAVGAAALWLWHDAIKPAWDGIVMAAKAVGAAALWVWNDAIKPAADGIGIAVRAVGAAAMWLWHDVFEPAWQAVATVFDAVADAVGFVWGNILEPIFGFIVAVLRFNVAAAFLLIRTVAEEVWDAIAAVAQWAWVNVLRPTWDALVLATKAVGAAAMWLWDNAFKPALEAIGAAALWLWNNVLTPAWDGIVTATKAVGAAGIWLWDNAFKPAINALASAALWLWHNVIEAAWRGIGTAIQWAWSNVIKPVWGYLGDGVNALKTGVLTFWHDGIEPAWHGIGDAISWVWNNVIKPIFDTFESSIKTVTGLFNALTDAINGGQSSAGTLGKGLGTALAGLSHNAGGGYTGLTGLPHKKDGGWIPGAINQARLVVAHGGEYVLSRDMIDGRAPIDPSAINSTAGGLTGGGGNASALGGSGSGPVNVNVNVNVEGHLLQTDRQLVDTLSELFAADGRRNNATYPVFAT